MSERDLVDNAASEPQVKRANSKVRRREEQQRAAFRAVMQTVQGRQVMWELLCGCKCYHSISSTDPLQMAILSGRRDVGLELAASLLKADENAYELMSKEARARDKREGDENESANVRTSAEVTG